ncbi:hypothetical protein AbraIFM66950_006815 [Aspergillus brasiliensis]|nr:hypothetical protein AbraIFM66950_006815 [Aspergillus brasiliensis]
MLPRALDRSSVFRGSRSWSHSVGADSQLTPTLSSHIPFHPPPSSAVSHRNRAAFDETYDVHDPTTLTTLPPQRQQQAASRVLPDSTRNPSLRPSSAVGSTRSLRRTARLSQRPPSVDVSGRPSQVEQTIPVVVRPVSEHPSGIAALRPALSEAQTEEDDEEADSEAEDSARRPGESYWPHRTTRVSPRTASAILWTLEEALRKPFPFTLDWDEVNAPMSDVAGASGPSGFGANGRTQNGSTRATQGPVPVNPHPASGVRTPTDIMRQRRDREARKKAEQEARDREQDDIERRQQQEQNRPGQAYAAGVAGDRTSQRRAQMPERSATTTKRPEPQASASIPGTGGAHGPRPTTSAGQPSASQQPHAAPQSSAGWSKQPTQAASEQPSSQAQQSRRIPFPHAFERWETLSSHWEGLTGYWIRKLEQNNEALERDPLNQQMARQVTDLSAAGANLFHAVVELQRLRASSERKFQRWFFDTRAEQERSKELLAELERQVRTERQARSDALTSLQKAESDKSRAEELLKEMRRELQISKDEARRAWEELGRREQEERDRTTSLRNGEPTLVGGVQVVPMIPGPASRHNTNRPPTRESPYASGESAARTTAVTEGQYYADTPASPTGTDPFVEGQRPLQEPPSSSPEAQRQYPGHFYEQGAAYPPRPTSENDDRSYGPSVASSEQGEEEAGGSYRRNPQGQSTAYQPAMSEGSDEYEHGSVEEGGYPPSSMPTTSGPHYGGYTQSVDYSGSGWGVGTGWESVTPRHRHPTRLSDVIEEEEPRTTPSRASLASRSVQ